MSKADEKEAQVEQIRSFIAISIPEEIKQKLREVQARLKRAEAMVKWTRPEGIHITLRFLGNISIEEVKQAGEAIAQVAQKFSPFAIEAKGFGTFPERARPRVIWVGLTQGVKELKAIFEELEKELLNRGLGKADRALSPHLTLGRIKTGKNLNKLLEYLKAEPEISYGIFEAKSICLYRSQLRPEGAIYTVLREEFFSGQ